MYVPDRCSDATYAVCQSVQVIAPLQIRERSGVHLLPVVGAIWQDHAPGMLSVIPILLHTLLTIVLIITPSLRRIFWIYWRGSGPSRLVKLPTKMVFPIEVPVVEFAAAHAGQDACATGAACGNQDWGCSGGFLRSAIARWPETGNKKN